MIRRGFQWFERWQAFRPSRHVVTTGRELGRPMEETWITTSDGVRIHGWFYPGKPDSPARHWVFLLLHGNAGNISHRLLHAGLLLQTGAAAFLVDYRGYGRSEGQPSEPGTYLDAEAAHAWLLARGFAGRHILPIGESLGGGVASHLALQLPVGGLILLNTFTSLPEIGQELFPWMPIRRYGALRYDTLARLPRIPGPILVLHARADRLVPFHHAERNFAAARDPKWLVQLPGGHNDFVVAGHLIYRHALTQLLDRLASSPMPEASTPTAATGSFSSPISPKTARVPRHP